MNYKVGKFEAIFLVLIVVTNKILLNTPKEIIRRCNRGAPVNIIFTCLLALIITALICKLFKKFPNEDIIDISKYVGKKPLQILLGISFLVFFTIVIITVLYEFINLLQMVYFPNTPISLLLLFFLFAMGFANKKGFKSLIKTNSIVVVSILISLIVIFTGTAHELNFNRVTPVLGDSLFNTFVNGSQNIFAYGGLIYLLFLIPFLRNKKDFNFVAGISILLSGLFLLFTTITLLALFPFIMHSEEMMSLYLLTRSVKFGNFFERTDAIFIFLWLICAFSYLSISMMFMINIFKKLTNCRESTNFSYSFLAIFFALIILFQNQTAFRFLETIFYKYLILSLLGISLIILIIANIKRKDYSKWKNHY